MEKNQARWRSTTILSVRKGGTVVVAGDGQVTLGQTIMKPNARKVRRLGKGEVIAGFAGATADAFALFERLEAKLEQHPGNLARACVELGKDWRTDKYLRRLGTGEVIAGFAGTTADAITLFERLEGKLEQYSGQLTRACVELAKDWRTDRYLRRLEAMMLVADVAVSLVLTGTGDVLEPESGVMGIGSGGNYALAAARALADGPLDAETIVRRSLDIAADICVYTNRNLTIETLSAG